MSSVTGKVVSTKFIGRSKYGNPSYSVLLDNGVEYRTSANANIAYAINNGEFRDYAHEFTLTKAGRLIGYHCTVDCPYPWRRAY